MPEEVVPSIGEAWDIFTANVRPSRLFQEDTGVEGPLWFGRKHDSPWHNIANLLRLFCAIVFAPLYVFIPHGQKQLEKKVLRHLLWGIEWAKTPDAVLLEAPGSLVPDKANAKVTRSKGEYAVTGNKPNWMLEVKFQGATIVSQEQVQYEWQGEKARKGRNHTRSQEGNSLQARIRRSGYTAISYSMDSAVHLFENSSGVLEEQPDVAPGGKRKYSLENRKKIAQTVLDEYARARESAGGENDVEFIWLDEFCLSDSRPMSSEECSAQRDAEIGKLADIFRRANRVVVFCHIEDCDHTDISCPWGQRLFTLGEILYTPQVLVMTRTRKSSEDTLELESQITIVPGHDFRFDMQARAAEEKMWHLYNIMQHATNSGAVTWQSAIHSLVVEAIRRDEAGSFDDHNLLGKALNGLLPRRSQLSDLQGVNGWADLAWLLELNQGYYNTTLLAAVCRLADPKVTGYRWWGKPIPPREGSERLEALVTCIPVKVSKSAGHPPEPALSIIGPKSVPLSHVLQRDSAGLYNNPEMKRLKQWMMGIAVVMIIVGFSTFAGDISAAIAILWLTAVAYVVMELLVGTIFVRKDTWVVIEDHTVKRQDSYRWLQSQDPTFIGAPEWGARQLIPQWDAPIPKNSNTPTAPYAVTLVDLRTGVWTRAAVTNKPNDMVVLAVHGSGITCMLLDREEKLIKSTLAAKVGMANLPPYVLALAEYSGSIYVGDIAAVTRKRKLSQGPSHVPPRFDVEKGKHHHSH